MADEDLGRSRGRDSEKSRERDPDDSRGPSERDGERAPGARDFRPDREQPLDPEDAFDRETTRRTRDESGLADLGFSLPPISLPDVSLPERIRLAFPIPEPPEKVSKPTRVRVSWVLLGVVLADALDALAVLWAGPDALVWVRAVVGTTLAVTLVRGPGLLYAWELLVVLLGGFGTFSVAPTLTVLVLGRVLFSE